MKPQFFVTYEIVTPESAENGEAAEGGFAMPGGWQYELPADCCGAAAGAFKAQHALDLRSAVGMMGSVEDSGLWFSETEGRVDYQDGSETRYSLHCPESITASSYRRIARLLGTKG